MWQGGGGGGGRGSARSAAGERFRRRALSKVQNDKHLCLIAVIGVDKVMLILIFFTLKQL